MVRRLKVRVTALIWLVTACTVAGDPAQPTPTAYRVESQRHTQTAPAAAFECGVTDIRAGTTHRVTAAVDYPTKVVTVTQVTSYVNRTGHSLNDIEFSVEANREARMFTLVGVTFADGSEASYELDANRLSVELSSDLPPGCSVAITLAFELHVPPVHGGVRGYRGYLGYTERQLNLANWLPTVASRLEGDWLVPDATVIGEQQVADIADWNVIVTVNGGPEDLQIAAPGVIGIASDGSLSITHTRARDLAISMSDQFVFQSRETGDITIELYAFADTLVQTDSGIVDGAQAALNAAADAVSMYSDLFGPVIDQRLVIVEGDFPDGMEFSGLVFVSRDWFRTYNGTPQSYLIIITVHEIAHQWWYASVGNDAANSPWLDEALATYSEYIYYEEFYPELRDWWWDFRVNPFAPDDYVPAGQVGSSVYRFGTIREYINAVYLRGARMLHALRGELGTDAFFDLLRRYADAGVGRVVDGDLFWSLLTPDQSDLAAPVRDRFFDAQ